MRNKHPKFIVTLDIKVYVGLENESFSKITVKTNKIGNDFFVLGGYGQLTNARIYKEGETNV